MSTLTHNMASKSRGARYENWLHNPTDTSCPIPPATLTLEDLVEDRVWTVKQVVEPKTHHWHNMSDNGLIFLLDDHQQMASEFCLSDDQVYGHIEAHGDTSSPFNWTFN